MKVTDNGFPRKFSTIIVTVIVVRNRNGPVFTDAPYEIAIDENLVSGSQILDVITTEGDNVRLYIHLF